MGLEEISKAVEGGGKAEGFFYSLDYMLDQKWIDEIIK